MSIMKRLMWGFDYTIRLPGVNNYGDNNGVFNKMKLDYICVKNKFDLQCNFENLENFQFWYSVWKLLMIVES